MTKKIWTLRIAALLLCLTCLTTSMVAGLYARYTMTSGGSSAARVAKFSINETNYYDSVTLNVAMVPGESVNKSVSVTNNSEVSVHYSVTIRNTTRNLPLHLTVGGADQTSAFNSDSGYTIAADLAPNGSSTSLSFSINWPAAQTSSGYSGMVDEVTVAVTAAQID